jgi:hypothetical protein
MYDKFDNKNNHKNNIIITFMVIVLFTTILNSYFNYTFIKKNFDKNVECTLKSTALYSNILLGENFHDRAISKDSISKEEDYQNIINLSNFVNDDEIKVEYVYSMVIRDNQAFFTSSSATESELRDLNNLTHYFDYYENSTSFLLNVFNTNKIVYEESIDK